MTVSSQTYSRKRIVLVKAQPHRVVVGVFWSQVKLSVTCVALETGGAELANTLTSAEMS